MNYLTTIPINFNILYWCDCFKQCPNISAHTIKTVTDQMSIGNIIIKNYNSNRIK